MESPQYKRIIFVDQKQRSKEARFLTYKNTLLCEDLEWSAGCSFKKNYLFESKILEMQNYRHWLVSITIYFIRNKISRFF